MRRFEVSGETVFAMAVITAAVSFASFALHTHQAQLDASLEMRIAAISVDDAQSVPVDFTETVFAN